MLPRWRTPPDTSYLNLGADKAALCSCKQIYAFSWTDFDPGDTPTWSKHVACHMTTHTSARGFKIPDWLRNPFIREMWTTKLTTAFNNVPVALDTSCLQCGNKCESFRAQRGKIILQWKKNTIVFLLDYVPSHLYSMCTAIVCLQEIPSFIAVFREHAEDPGRSQIPHHVMRLHHSEAVHLRHNGILPQKQTGPEAWALRLSRGCFCFLFCEHHKFGSMSGAFHSGTQCFSSQMFNLRDASSQWVHDVSATSSAMSHFLNIILRDDKRNWKKKKWKHDKATISPWKNKYLFLYLLFIFYLKSFSTPHRHFDLPVCVHALNGTKIGQRGPCQASRFM